MSILKPENVPDGLTSLLPVAEMWGIGDDFAREQAIKSASLEKLISLVHSIDGVTDEQFYGWLSGPESFNTSPSLEYVAMSNLAMAIDSARSQIRKINADAVGRQTPEVSRERLVEWLNSIEWRQPKLVTPEAESLIDDHLVKIKRVVNEVMAKKGLNAVDAAGFSQAAGHDTPEGQSLLDDLFAKVVFRDAGVRTSLIATTVAAYCWEFDPELRHLPNPWLPLVELYGMGYTTSGDGDPDGNGLALLVGYNDGVRSYRIV